MLTLSAKIREISGKKVKNLRKKDVLPAVLYGPDVKNLTLEINMKDFDKVFNEAGESSLIKIETAESPKKEFQVLIHDIQRESATGKPLHVDFYAPPTKEEIVVKVPIILEGTAAAIKELGGTLVKDIHEIEIKGLIQDLPKEIKIDISILKTFEDHISVRDLNLPQGVKVLKNPEEIVVSAAPPEKVEEELVKPIEEKVEEVEVIEKEKKVKEKPEAAPEEKPK